MMGRLTQLLSTTLQGKTRRGCADLLTLPVRLLLVAFLVMAAGSVNALPGDREQPIHITADKAVRDEKKGVTIYSGNVKMRQGSMHLEADSLTIYHDAENADQIVAQGSPAKMRQRPKPEASIVRAQATVITYFRSEDRVHLQTGARIEQEGDLVTGDSINYLISKELITAESDKSQAGDKVNVVLQPTVTPARTAPPAGEETKTALATGDTPISTDTPSRQAEDEAGSGTPESK